MSFLEIVGLVYLLGLGVAFGICLFWALHPSVTGTHSNGNPKVRNLKDFTQIVFVLLFIVTTSWVGAIVLWLIGIDERSSNKLSNSREIR